MLADNVDAVIGVDTHRDTHTAALLHSTGAVIDTTVITSDPAGFAQLLDFVTARAPGDRLVWAVEGTRSYGVGLLRFLQSHGQAVVEIDSPKRPARRRGKSDERDAVQAAREALARDLQTAPRADGRREGLRVLLLARDSAVTARTAAQRPGPTRGSFRPRSPTYTTWGDSPAMVEAAGLLDQQVDGLGTAVAEAVGVEVGQDLRAPGAEIAADSGDRRDRAAGQAGDEHPASARRAAAGRGPL